jgi:hypothetical protein
MSDLLMQQISTVNDGLQPTPPTIASAATIAPSNFLTFLTGTVQLATITPFTTGAHMICLIFTNASPGAFVTTGNIKAALQPVQNLPVFLIWDPVSSLWWGAPGLLS